MPRKQTVHRVSNAAAEKFGLDKLGRVNRRAMSDETWQGLVDYFGKKPGDIAGAARACDVTYTTAKKAYHKGNAHMEGRPPIKSLVAREIVDLRAECAELRRMTDEDRKLKERKAKDDALDDKAMADRLLRIAQKNSLMLQGVTGALNQTAARLVHRINDKLDDPDDDMNVFQLLAVTNKIIRMFHTATEAAGITSRMRKEMMGEPDTVVNVHQTLSPEAALRLVQDSSKLSARLQKMVAKGDGIPAAIAGQTVDASLVGEDGMVDLDKIEAAVEAIDSEPLPPTKLPPDTSRTLEIQYSSNIEVAEYEEASNTLWVTFASGHMYRYQNVPSDIVETWESAPSAGRYFSATFKNNDLYPVDKVD